MTAPLPRPTSDLAHAKSDLARHGYTILTGLLDGEAVAEMQVRLPELAAEEEARALYDHAQGETINQYVYMMINKGQVFLDLVQHPAILDMVGHVLGPEFLLSASDAILCKPGGAAMPLRRATGRRICAPARCGASPTAPIRADATSRSPPPRRSA